MTTKEHGFLFSADMARALHYTPSPKTQTRRLPSPTKIMVNGKGISSKRWQDMGIDFNRDGALTAGGASVQAPWFNPSTGQTETVEITPRVQAGDLMWVREGCHIHTPAGDNPHKPHAVYLADNTCSRHAEQGQWECKPTPGLHMPRWATRYVSRITGVRFERLRSISHADALAEGVECWRSGWDIKSAATAFLMGTQARIETNGASVPVRLYYMLWEQINGRGSWARDPIVLVYTFERIADAQKGPAA